jgi:hypothetical protein
MHQQAPDLGELVVDDDLKYAALTPSLIYMQHQVISRTESICSTQSHLRPPFVTCASWS